METSLDKNLKQINPYNPKLCERLRTTPLNTDKFTLNTNLVGEYNLLINNMPIHSVTGAQEEAKEHFENLKKDTKNVIHVIYGMGLGYLLDYFSLNAKGNIIVFEPDLELLKFVFETADLSDQLKNTFITSDIEELRTVYTDVFKYKTTSTLTIPDFYRFNKKEETKMFSDFLFNLQNEFDVNYLYQSQTMNEFLNSMLCRLDKKTDVPLFGGLKDSMKNKPAIIVSAGPSLNKNLETLKKHKDNAVIFSVGTALKTLIKNDIMPDFVNYIEKFYNAPQFEDTPIDNLNLIAEPYSAWKLFDMNFKRTFLTISNEANVNHLFSHLSGLDNEYTESKGTVAYQALYCAKMLGCNPIILLGQDLAYVDGKCYSRGTIFEDLVCKFDKKNNGFRIAPDDMDKFKNSIFSKEANKSDEAKNRIVEEYLKQLNTEIQSVMGVNGEILPTSYNYKRFVSYFEDFAQRFSGEIDLYNASNGADIKGFKVVALDDLMTPFAEKIEVEDVLNKHLPVMMNKKITLINLKQNQEFFSKMVEFLAVCQKELQVADANKILAIKDKINEFRTKNPMFRLLTLKSYNEFTFLLKETPEIISLQKEAQQFLIESSMSCKKLIVILNKNIAEINESLNK